MVDRESHLKLPGLFKPKLVFYLWKVLLADPSLLSSLESRLDQVSDSILVFNQFTAHCHLAIRIIIGIGMRIKMRTRTSINIRIRLRIRIGIGIGIRILWIRTRMKMRYENKNHQSPSAPEPTLASVSEY